MATDWTWLQKPPLVRVVVAAALLVEAIDKTDVTGAMSRRHGAGKLMDAIAKLRESLADIGVLSVTDQGDVAAELERLGAIDDEPVARNGITGTWLKGESAENTLKSLATMLGWTTVPPRETLERTIAALKARAKSSPEPEPHVVGTDAPTPENDPTGRFRSPAAEFLAQQRREGATHEPPHTLTDPATWQAFGTVAANERFVFVFNAATGAERVSPAVFIRRWDNWYEAPDGKLYSTDDSTAVRVVPSDDAGRGWYIRHTNGRVLKEVSRAHEWSNRRADAKTFASRGQAQDYIDLHKLRHCTPRER